MPAGQIEFVKGSVVWRGPGPYKLPLILRSAFLNKIFNSRPDDMSFIGQLAQDLCYSEKERLQRTCVEMGGQTKARWAELALTWASVANADNKWDLENFTLIYEAVVNEGWAQRVAIASCGTRFVFNPRGVFSVQEFQHVYGQTITSYLVERRDDTKARLSQIITCLMSPIQAANVVLQNLDGTERSTKIPVLACQTPDDWHVPSGTRLLRRLT